MVLKRSLSVALVVVLALAAVPSWTNAADMDTSRVEDSTVSPIADMAILDSEMKTSTEKPPTMENMKQDEKQSSQRHTVADFIIHPLIAFKPRTPEEESSSAAGKQASSSSTSSTTQSPWQLFGFNTGQGISSSVSNLAGSVTGWLNGIQLPGLMETPIRDSSSTSTTTTPRPDIVVQVQHRGSTRRPLISINNRNRPNQLNFDSEENDDDDEYDEDETSAEGVDNETSDEADEGDNSEEEEDNEDTDKDQDDNEREDSADDDEQENHSQRPNNRRRPIRNQNGNNRRRRIQPQNSMRQQNNRRRFPNRQRQPFGSALDYDQYDDDEGFYYGARPSTKRSQNNQNFIQRGQQQLINQIRQLTWGQTPAEIGSAIRKSQVGSDISKRRQQATLFVNRNGQTIYMAPELTQLTQPQYQQVYAQPIVHKASPSSSFPQPPLSAPYRKKGQPTQYITIPWSKLGISPPNSAISITEGIQAQPLILNIPQSAINTMQNQSINRRKKRPQLITPDAVPLLAEASLMDIFKPPQIPPSRTTSSNKPIASATPVLMASKPSSMKTSTSILQQRIRPGTIVEKAPDMESALKPSNLDNKMTQALKEESHQVGSEKEFILVGNDDEPGLTRQVEPVLGEARYVRLTGNSPYYDVLPRRRFTVRREGRELTPPEPMNEQLIPVEIVSDAGMPSPSDPSPDSTAKADVAITPEGPKAENMDLSPSETVVSTLPAEDAQLPHKPETT